MTAFAVDVLTDPVIPQGAYAEYIRLPGTNVMPKPAHLSWEEAASIPENFLTGAGRASRCGGVSR